MDKKTQELFEMFKLGVEKERDAQKLYQQMIDLSDSDLQKEIFGGFLKEEQKHEQKLMQAYAEMKEKNGLK